MKTIKQLILIACLALLSNLGFAQSGSAPTDKAEQYRQTLRSLNWMKGPQSVQLFDKATVEVPKGYVFLNPDDAQKFMTLNENLSHGTQYIFAPSDLHWFGIFTFKPDGYVKDDEKIDASAILDSIRQGTEQANQQRRDKGWPEMTIVGWKLSPQYDTDSKRLEWAINGKSSSGEVVVNYNTRILGRSGVTSAVLVVSPDRLDAAVSDFKSSLRGFDYNSGEKYSEFRQGDKVAEYGLAALVVGGAAALATKTGFWKTIAVALAAGWKFVAAAVIGLFSWIGRLFKRKND